MALKAGSWGNFILFLSGAFIGVATAIAQVNKVFDGHLWTAWCLYGLAALLILVWLILSRRGAGPVEDSPLTKDSGNATATGGTGGNATATGNSLTQHLHFPGAASAPHPAAPPKREPLPLKVEFEPSVHQSEKLYLAVKNMKAKQAFRAQCRVVERRNDPNPQPRMTFDLTWLHGGRDKILQQGETGNLLIASAGRDQMRGLEWMKLEGVNAPDSHWPWPEKKRPEYDLEITVLGNQSEETQTEKFTLKAGGTCALLMDTRT